MKNTAPIFLLSVGLFFSCETSNQSQIGKDFFETYALRKDEKILQSFYNDTIEYENVVLQSGLHPISSVELIRTNFNFNDAQMVYPNDTILRVEQLMSNDTMIVAQGYFLPYQYQGLTIPEMKFTTWLFLDKNKKIKKQIDWFNYPIEDIIQAYQMKQSMNFSTAPQIQE